VFGATDDRENKPGKSAPGRIKTNLFRLDIHHHVKFVPRQ
jgi:hypothetical protein